MILNAFNSAYEIAKKRNFEKIFIAVDIHNTIIYPDYNNTTIEFFSYAKETLQLLSSLPEITLILYTCSYPEEIEKYQKVFKENDIIFKYVNENPEVPNTQLGCFDTKFYFQVLLDDKSGFNGETDWKIIYEYYVDKIMNKVNSIII